MTFFLELKGLLKLRGLQLSVLAFMLACMGALSLIPKAPVRDADMWWHLKVGDWILAHHAFPHVGIFSRTAAESPWIAYSWGYEVILSRAYAWFGLMGVAVFGVSMVVAVAWVLFWSLNRLSGSFWRAWVLCLLGSMAFLFNLLPRPVLLSMMLFVVMLALLLEAHRSGRAQPLYWLPFLFVCWANLHIQFVYGLFTFGLFVGISVTQRVGASWGWAPRFLTPPTLRANLLLVLFLLCVLACCVGPYSYHLFGVVLEYSRSKVPYLYSQELQPPDFKHPSDYFLVLLALAALYAVTWKKPVDLFKLALLIIATVLAMRTLRDAWFLAVCACAFLADLPSEKPDRSGMKVSELLPVAALLVVMLFLVAGNTGFNSRELDRAISSDYPVDAVNYLRRHPLPGPLYNDFGWGGFLIWYMPEYPVAIDGRNDLYGDAVDLVTFESMGGSYASDPYLQEARLVLIPRDTPLAGKLADDPHFRVVFEDRLAVVFVRN